MLQQEFTERTGYVPTINEYKDIEEEYYNSPLQKDAFCAQWMEDNKGRIADQKRKVRKAKENEKKAEKIMAEMKEALSMADSAWNHYCKGTGCMGYSFYYDTYKENAEKYNSLVALLESMKIKTNYTELVIF